MRTQLPKDQKDGQSFPQQRPEIAVRELDGVPFAVECPELRWWLVVPSRRRVGEQLIDVSM